MVFLVGVLFEWYCSLTPVQYTVRGEDLPQQLYSLFLPLELLALHVFFSNCESSIITHNTHGEGAY